MTVLNLQVGAGDDDAVEGGTGGINQGKSYLDFGVFDYWHVGMRFTGVSGLSGVTIDAATFTFRADGSDSGSFLGTFFAHDAEAPGTFMTTAYNISDTGQRPRTTALCGADGADFGNWTAGQGYTFAGDGVNTIAEIIQELADSYDPSAIALFWIRVSGFGERLAVSYDGDSALAPKLDIDYTAATGDQTATPDPVTMPLAVPSVSLTAGAVTVSPDPAMMTFQVPLPDVQAGAVTVSPDPAVMTFQVPLPDVQAGAVTISPDPATVPLVVPDPSVTGAGETTISPDPATITLAVPSVSLTAGVVTISPDAGTMPLSVPDVALDVTLQPSPATVTLAVLTPSLGMGAVTISPDPATIPFVVPAITLTGAGEQITTWGIIEQFIDPDEWATGTVFLIQVGMFTSAAAVPIKCRLFNITDGVVVSGSVITSIATSYEIIRSSTFSLTSGLKKYRLEFGGEIGGVYSFHGGDVKAVSS